MVKERISPIVEKFLAGEYRAHAHLRVYVSAG